MAIKRFTESSVTEDIKYNSMLAGNTKTYKIGDIGPGGGKVFYVATTTFTGGPYSTQCKYLEAALTTGTNPWTDAAYKWSGNVTTLIGTTADGIGTGYANTIAMVTQSSTAGRAGTVCRAYRGPNNLDDWYLASRDELNQLYIQRAIIGDMAVVTQWSSSEATATTARIRRWDNGIDGTDNKNTSNTTYVRPIRAF
jgi:hypothetical protein